MTKELDNIWYEIEAQRKSNIDCLQRMVCVDYLYRIYAGVEGVPSRRFVSIEIPSSQGKNIEEYTSPQGFSIAVTEPVVKHAGYVSCVLQSNNSDLNDVFSIVATDILFELRANTSEDEYVKSLTNRIEKWKSFFKNNEQNKISEAAEIGLFGELLFIKELMNRKMFSGFYMWNGPLKAAQDFQADKIAIEIKTVVSHSIEKVQISSEEQLDLDSREDLFLGVYRLERNDADGITLPGLIEELKSVMTDKEKRFFEANLYCLGYRDEDASKYKRSYSAKENKMYVINEKFPRLINSNMPKGVSRIKYAIDLNCCEEFAIDSEKIFEKIGMINNG